MEDRAERARFSYSAFISYNHHDRKVATRLQRRIERYRLPRRVARAAGSARLKPVFRDRDELNASPDLSGAVRFAIERSEHLIVICTPSSARSEWVGREIDYFRSIHGDDRILTALFEGRTATCFHPALLTARDGAPIQPLAADFTREGDGRLALLKLVAVLAHVGLDEVVQRDAQRRLHRFVLGAAVILFAVIVAAALILLAMQARAAAEQERRRGTDAVRFQLTELRGKLEAAGRLDLLAAVNQGVERYYDGQDARMLSVPALLQRAALLQAKAKDDEQRGKSLAARKDVIDAWKITATLLGNHPTDSATIYAHAQSEYWVGFIDWRLGDAEAARASFERYAALAKQLVDGEPSNPDWRLEQGYANSNLGMLALRESIDTTHARRFFRAAQADFVAVATQRPVDADLRYELADGEAWLADVERLDGDYTAALAHRVEQRRIIDDLLEQSPLNARYRLGLVANTLGMARIAAARRRFGDALDQLDAAHEAAVELAAGDPDNASVARQKRAIELFKVQTWLRMPTRQRPAANVILGLLGDCDAEWRKPDNDELAAFCTSQSAKFLIARGQSSTAFEIIQSLRKNRLFKDRALTERWRLNLLEEVNTTRT